MESIIGNLPEKQPESAAQKERNEFKMLVLDENMTENDLKNALGQVYEVWKDLEVELTQNEKK
jgi:hypothetical protein